MFAAQQSLVNTDDSKHPDCSSLLVILEHVVNLPACPLHRHVKPLALHLVQNETQRSASYPNLFNTAVRPHIVNVHLFSFVPLPLCRSPSPLTPPCELSLGLLSTQAWKQSKCRELRSVWPLICIDKREACPIHMLLGPFQPEVLEDVVSGALWT